jgi:restriction system protein
MIGDLREYPARESLIAAVQAAYPEYTMASVRMAASQLFRFAHEIEIGDRVVTYDPRARSYECGDVTGECIFVPDATDEASRNQRSVAWTHSKLRDELSDTARNGLGSISTLFVIRPEVEAELWSQEFLEGAPPVEIPPADVEAPPETPITEASAAELEEQARTAIADRIARLNPYAMQELVAGILRGMGFKTLVSAPGSDRGKDVIASPDGLGLTQPRIFVEVKHRTGQRVDAPEIRSFLGARRPGDTGLYVSTGGFTREARYEAERASIPLTLVDFEQLSELVLEHYPRFDEDARLLLPLKMIYWPLK